MEGMKKLLSFALIVFCSIALVSCGAKEPENSKLISTQENKDVTVGSSLDRINIEKPGETTINNQVGKPIEQTNNSDKITVTAIIQTNMGLIEIGLYGNDAPLTVANFLQKVNDFKYNGLTFHRIVQGFVIQGGDPLGNGSGGEKMAVDPMGKNNNKRGSLAMASSDQNYPISHQSDMQFFVNLVDNTSLDGMGFIPFGEVTSGMEVVDKMAKVQTGDNDKPLEPPIIERAYLKK